MRTLGLSALVITVLLCAGRLSAQEIRTCLSYRDIDSSGYFRFNYENDVFFGTDKYFTQGVHFELVNRGLSRGFIRRVFPASNCGIRWCGVGLESAGYSPTSITADSVLHGDHPFAGLSYLKVFSVSIDTVRHRRISGNLSLGWMGPSAGGYEIQSAIHKAVGSPEPRGWKYQLKDQPVVNYELNVEQEFVQMLRWLRLSAWGMLRAGTLSNRAAVGGILQVLSPVTSRASFRIYAHPALSFIAYESVLEGGPFTNDNPYSIAAADVKRFVGSALGGVDWKLRRLCIGAYVRWQSPTFHGATDHLVGGFTVASGF